MASKFCEGKTTIWIKKETHRRLRLEAFKMNCRTIGELAEVAINYYLDLLQENKETKDE